jgi:hypothetical protein
MMRDLFEAGLNGAAGSLAASYGRWLFARSVERIRCSGGVGAADSVGKVRSAIVAKPGYSTTIFAGFMGRHGGCRSARGEFAGARRWIARVSILVGRGDMVGELGVMSCHTVALNVAAKDAAMNVRRPCDRRNKGRCRGAGR